MNQDILLTGVSGFFGKTISGPLSESNRICGLSRFGSDFNFDLEKVIPDFDLQFDLVIHAAGKAHFVPKNDFDKNKFYQVNVRGTKNLLEGLTRSGIPKYFVFISSVAVYGVDQGENINENAPLLAKDSFGLSKIQAEQLVLDWCQKNKVICTILRLPLLVGDNPPGNLGAMINGIKKGYFFNIAGGLARKSIVLTEDVAKIILKASEIGGIYNLTDGNHPNFLELSNAIAKQNKKTNPFNIPFFVAKSIALFGDIIGDKFPLNSNKLKKITTNLTFDDTRAKEVLDWKPKKVLDYYGK